ncbi:E-selectin-like isoform X2 [Amphiura filiformis]
MAWNIINFLVILQLFAFALGNPPIDTPSRCANARRPENGHVKCCIDLSSFDDVDTNSGGESGGKSSGGKSSGGSSHGPDVYTCTYTCDTGFKLSGPSVLECPIDTITDNPTCEPVECEVLPRIDHGSLSCSESFQYGSVCQYKCAVGFDISGGSSSLTCSKDGMWNGIVPMCQPVQCPALEEPNHCSLSCPNGRTFGSDCRYRCDDRFKLDGPSVATCAANGTWTIPGNRLPICKISECTPLPLLVHGSLTCNLGWHSGTVCSYSCHRGYTLTGGNYLLRCDDSGFWRGDIPTCEAGNSTNTDFALYDFTDGGVPNGPSGIVGPDSGNDAASGGLNAAGIVAIVAVIVVLMGVVIGLFVAYRSTK